MDYTTTTYTFKARIAGWIIDKTTDTYESGRTETWYELIHPDDLETIVMAFQDREEMKRWARENPAT